VAAAADRQLQAGLARQRDHAGDVGGVGDPHDRRRPQVLKPAGEQGPGLVVAGITGGDHPPVQGGAELRD
jgi:hypothetical protein